MVVRSRPGRCVDHGDPLSRLSSAGTDPQGGSPQDTFGGIGGEAGTSAMKTAGSSRVPDLQGVSVVIFTTLGYGDITLTDSEWQLSSGIEALDGG